MMQLIYRRARDCSQNEFRSTHDPVVLPVDDLAWAIQLEISVELMDQVVDVVQVLRRLPPKRLNVP